MATKLKLNGKKLVKELTVKSKNGLKRATVFYHAECRRAVSKPNTGVSVPVQRQTPGGNKKSRTIYPNPSKPGEAPRLRTGQGQRGIVFEFSEDGMSSRVGVTKAAMHMFYLEVGTRRVARRPWLLATLEKNQNTIGKLAAAG